MAENRQMAAIEETLLVEITDTNVGVDGFGTPRQMVMSRAMFEAMRKDVAMVEVRQLKPEGVTMAQHLASVAPDPDANVKETNDAFAAAAAEEEATAPSPAPALDKAKPSLRSKPFTITDDVKEKIEADSMAALLSQPK